MLYIVIYTPTHRKPSAFSGGRPLLGRVCLIRLGFPPSCWNLAGVPLEAAFWLGASTLCPYILLGSLGSCSLLPSAWRLELRALCPDLRWPCWVLSPSWLGARALWSCILLGLLGSGSPLAGCPPFAFLLGLLGSSPLLAARPPCALEAHSAHEARHDRNQITHTCGKRLLCRTAVATDVADMLLSFLGSCSLLAGCLRAPA